MRLRFRKGLFSTYLKSPRDTPEFWEEYQAALAGTRAAEKSIGKSRHKPGSVAAVVLSYYRSPEFLGLSASTRATYGGILDRFVKRFGDNPVRLLQRQHIKGILGDMADRPHAANNLLRMLKLLLDFAVDAEILTRNPARGMKGFKARSTGFATWSEADIGAYEKRHPIGTKPRLAMALMLYTGQRRGDVVKLGWQNVEGDRIVLRQGKTGEPLKIKMHRALIEALAHAPRTNMTFLVTQYDAPFSAAGFGNWFREQCDAAGLPGRTAHGLRKAAARRLADVGNSTKRIQAVTGHRTLKEVERYTRESDQQRLADEAVESMPDRTDREQDLPNLPKRLDKNQRKRLK